MRKHNKFFDVSFNAFLLCSLTVIFGLAAVSLGQDNTFDARSYHFYNGFAFLYNRLDWHFAPSGHQSYFNPIFDVINYLLIVKTSPTIITALHGALTGVTLFIIYRMGTLLFVNLTQRQRVTYLFFSVLIGATSTDNLSLLGLITNDSKAAFLVIFSLYCLVKSISSEGKTRTAFMMLAGIFSGLATAFKLTTACYAMDSCAALFFIVLQDRQYVSLLMIYIASTGISFLIGDGYWMLTLYKHFSNPLFPYYNHFFHSPYAADSNYKDPLYFPHDYFTFPFLFGFFKTTTEEHLRDMRFAMIYVMGVIFVFQSIYQYLRRTKVNVKQNALTMAWQVLFIWFLVGYILWFYLFTIFRYALPLEIVTGLILTYLVHQLVMSERMVLALLIALTIILFSTTVKTRYDRIPLGQHFYEATPPRLPTNAIVFLESYPAQYTIPFFQKDIRFVGDIELINKDQLNKLVNLNKDKVFILKFVTVTNHNINDFTAFLQTQHHLTVDYENCVAFSTNIGDAFEVCQTK